MFKLLHGRNHKRLVCRHLNLEDVRKGNLFKEKCSRLQAQMSREMSDW